MSKILWTCCASILFMGNLPAIAEDWRDGFEKRVDSMGRGLLAPVTSRRALEPGFSSSGRYDDDEPTPTPTPLPLLEGPNRLEITAINAETGEPIQQFQVHAVLIVEDPDKSHAAKRAQGSTGHPMLRVARFESLDTAKGSVTYQNLPDGQFEFQVAADGHFPMQSTIALPANPAKLEIRLPSNRSLKGRLLDAANSAPIPDMAIEFHAKKWPAGSLIPRDWKGATAATVTGSDGAFEFKQLPPAKISLYFPEIPKSEGDLDQLVRKREEIIPEDAVGAAREEANALLREMVAAEFGYAIPTAEADLTTELAGDIGNVMLQRLPVLNLQVVDENDAPIRNAWYSLDNFSYRSDIEGRARTPLWGFVEGNSVKVSASRNREDLNRRLQSNTDNGADSPNMTIQPKANETADIKLVCKPREGDYRIRLNVVDAGTGSPIPDFEVVVGEGSNTASILFGNSERSRQRQLASQHSNLASAISRSGDGRIVISGIRYEAHQLEEIQRLKNPSPDYPLPSGKWAERSHYRSVVVFAPGYVREVFGIHYDSILNDEEVTLKLEKEAVVKGVMMLAGDPPVPITPGRVRSLHPKPTSAINGRERRPDPIVIRVLMTNKGLQSMEESLMSPRFSGEVYATIEEDGTFQFVGLKPAGDWTLSAIAEGLPGFVQRGIELKVGENDLGRIVIGAAGKLSGYLLDEAGEPLSPAVMTFPMGGPQVEVQPDGSFETTLKHFREDEQLIRVIPSWGMDAHYTEDAPHIYYEFVKHMNRYGENHWTPRLERGKALTVRVALSEAAIAMAKENIKPHNNMFEDDRAYRGSNAGPTKYRIVAAGLMRFDTEENELVYHQVQLLPRDGLPMEGVQSLQLDNVPAGKMALIVFGSIFRSPSAERLAGLEPERVDAPHYGEAALLPISYQEFVMPSHAHTLDAQVSAGEIEFELEGDPPTTVQGEGIQITLEREGPQSYSFGGAVQRSFNSVSSSRDLDLPRLFQPVVGLFGSILYDNSKAPRIFLVPSGTYRLRAWSNTYDMMSPHGNPHYETTVEIRDFDSKVKVSIPAPKAK